ncbi:hypothetical protein JZU71_00050 [bacterium]|nr:hypothetical protein [bacterium]
MTDLLPKLTPEQEAEILAALSAKESQTKAQVIKVRPGAIERNSTVRAVKMFPEVDRRIASVKLRFGMKNRRKTTRHEESNETTGTKRSQEVDNDTTTLTSQQSSSFSMLCGAFKKLILG